MTDARRVWQGLQGFRREGEIWCGDHDFQPLGPDAAPAPWPNALRWPTDASCGDNPCDRVVALDIETTGLAGAASMVFLVGLAWREGARVRVRQLLALDLPFEEALIDRLGAELADAGTRLVTYNGDTFDLPFLRTRARFQRVRLSLPPALDLLRHTRRLYRDRDGSCRLGHLEATRLGHARTDDLPGALVPQVYYEALRDDEPQRLDPVLRHNAMDLVATLGLLWQVGHDMVAPLPEGAGAAELFGRYRSAAADGDAERARLALEACLAADPAPWLRRQALSRLSHLHREAGALDARHDLWESAAAAPDAPWDHLVEWAKILEHERRDLAGAHAAAGAALARLRAQARLIGRPADPAQEAAIVHRLARIERRMARNAAQAGG